MKVLYFSHDCNAMGDNKITDLRADYGMEGYGVYWGIVEALSREPDLTLPYTKHKVASLRLSMAPSFDMKKFIDDCIGLGLFESDGKRFWSESLKKRLSQISDISQKRREAAYARWGKPEHKQKEALLPAPEDMEQILDSIDPEWKKVTDEYQKQIGMLPYGDAADNLMSYFDEMGADAMIVAIRETNKAQPDKPYWYLKAILEAFSKSGIRSAEAAEAQVKDYERKKQSWGAQNSGEQQQTDQTNDGNVRWLC